MLTAKEKEKDIQLKKGTRNEAGEEMGHAIRGQKGRIALSISGVVPA